MSEKLDELYSEIFEISGGKLDLFLTEKRQSGPSGESESSPEDEQRKETDEQAA